MGSSPSRAPRLGYERSVVPLGVLRRAHGSIHAHRRTPMSYLTLNGCRYFVQDTGAPRPDAPPIVFAHGFLMSHEQFAHQVGALRDRYRCVSLDWRGQGAREPSPVRRGRRGGSRSSPR